MENGRFVGFVDVILKRVYRYEDNIVKEVEILSGLSDKIEEIRNCFIEDLVENDENLMEKYFVGEEIFEDEIYRGFSEGIK